MRVDTIRYVAAASSIVGLAGALGLCVAQSFAYAQPTASVLKVPAVTKFEPMPKVLTGTLFNTQEQRDLLDRARLRGGAPEAEVVAPIEGERSVINGFVKRSDGRNTVWVDDVMKRDPRSEIVEQLDPNVVGANIVVSRLKPAVELPTQSNLKRQSSLTSARNKHESARRISKARLRKNGEIR